MLHGFTSKEIAEAWDIQAPKASQSADPFFRKLGRLYLMFPQKTLVAIAGAAACQEAEMYAEQLEDRNNGRSDTPVFHADGKKDARRVR